MKDLRLTSILGGLAFANMALAFAYQWYVVTMFGAGGVTDALVAAMVLPQLVLAIFSNSLTQVLVPLLATRDGDDLRNVAWGFALGVGGLFGALSLVLIATAPCWVSWTVPGFTSEQVALTVRLAVVQLFGMVFIAMVAVFSAVSHARQRFVWAESMGLVATVVSLIVLVWGLPRFGIVAAAWGLFSRPLVQTLLLLPVAGRFCWPSWKSVPLRETWRRLRPLVIGTAYYKTGPLVDRILTSMAIPGAMTLLHLAQQLYGAGSTVVSKALATPMIPVQAKHAACGNWQAFRAVLKQRLVQCGLLTLVCWCMVLIAGDRLLPFLFANRLAPSDIDQLWWLLVLLGGMWVGGSLGSISSGAYYATGDTKTPSRLGIITYTVYVPIKVFLFWQFGLAGLALSISAFYLVNFLLQLYYLGFPRLGRAPYAGH